MLLGLTRRAAPPTRPRMVFFFNVALAFIPATLRARPMTGNCAPRSIFSCLSRSPPAFVILRSLTTVQSQRAYRLHVRQIQTSSQDQATGRTPQ